MVVVYPKENLTFDDTFVDLAELEPEDLVDKWPVIDAAGDAVGEIVLGLLRDRVHTSKDGERFTASLASAQFHCAAEKDGLFCIKL